MNLPEDDAQSRAAFPAKKFGLQLAHEFVSKLDFGEEKSLLLLYADRYYRTRFKDAALMGQAIWSDLEPTPVLSEVFGPLLCEYLGSVGRMVGKVYLQGHFSSTLNDKAAFGMDLAKDMRNTGRSWLKHSMKDWAISRLNSIYPELFTEVSADHLGELVDVSKWPDLLSDPAKGQKLAQAGREFLAFFLSNEVKSTLGGESVMRTVLFDQYRLYTKTYPKPPALLFKALVALAQSRLMEYIRAFMPPSNPVLGVPWDKVNVEIQGAGFDYAQADKTKFLGRTMLEVISWCLDNHSASSSTGTPPISIFAKLPPPNPSLVATGRKALIFYAEKAYLTQGKSVTDLVHGLMTDFGALPGKSDGGKPSPGLAAVGAFFLAGFVEKQATSDALFVGKWVPDAWPPDAPKGLTNRATLAGNALRKAVKSLQAQLGTVAVNESKNQAQISQPLTVDPYQTLGKMALLQLILGQPEKILGNEMAVANLIQTKILQPVPVAKLALDISQALVDAGKLLLYYFLNSQFSWQMRDSRALGSALAFEFPHLFDGLTVLPP
ncbi:MAG: hypothetical protein AAF570_19350, partial [Bacteroidota bacterium]